MLSISRIAFLQYLSCASNNSIINDVLNETAEAETEWEQMGGGTYDSSKIHEVVSSQHKNNPTAPNNAPDFLTKDYSALLKKVDEKAKQSRG